MSKLAEVLLIVFAGMAVTQLWRIAQACELMRDRLFELTEMLAGRAASRLEGLWRG